jgi:hypothetical protein
MGKLGTFITAAQQVHEVVTIAQDIKGAVDEIRTPKNQANTHPDTKATDSRDILDAIEVKPETIAPELTANFEGIKQTTNQHVEENVVEETNLKDAEISQTTMMGNFIRTSSLLVDLLPLMGADDVGAAALEAIAGAVDIAYMKFKGASTDELQEKGSVVAARTAAAAIPLGEYASLVGMDPRELAEKGVRKAFDRNSDISADGINHQELKNVVSDIVADVKVETEIQHVQQEEPTGSIEKGDYTKSVAAMKDQDISALLNGAGITDVATVDIPTTQINSTGHQKEAILTR